VKFAVRKATARTAAVAGLAAVALLGATGCSSINQQATTLQYSASDGIVANVGDAELRNVLLVSSGPDAEARYLGAVNNPSEQPLEVTITVDGTDTRLSVPAGEMLQLGDPENEHVIPSHGSFPGGMADATVEVDGQSQQVEIPVLDGTLPEYRQYVPGGADESATEHLYETHAAEEGGH